LAKNATQHSAPMPEQVADVVKDISPLSQNLGRGLAKGDLLRRPCSLQSDCVASEKRIPSYTDRCVETIAVLGQPFEEMLRCATGSGILHLAKEDVSRDTQTSDQGTDHFEAEASAP
jgi:hypothetical protein